MTKQKTKEQILQEAFKEIKIACINIKDALQASEVTLIDLEILRLADKFFEVLHKQNSKIIVTGDGK